MEECEIGHRAGVTEGRKSEETSAGESDRCVRERDKNTGIQYNRLIRDGQRKTFGDEKGKDAEENNHLEYP